MSEIKVNKISPRTACGTTTLGDSGDSFVIPSGATITNNGTQVGFGRTGTVNWVTTKKTTGFTAVSGNGYFCDTAASGAFTLTLPSSPSAGDIVGMKDYNGNFATANLTIGRGGSKINGGSGADVVIETSGASIFLVYVDATQGWVATQDDSSTFSGDTFMVATGGTITTCGNDKIHTFTGPGTFTVCSVGSCAANNLVSYVVVAGGGGSGYDGGGGGGAGGYRELVSPGAPYTGSPTQGYPTPGNRITVTATGFPITVGGGGGSGPPSGPGVNGSDSIFSTITSAGGGGGHSSGNGLDGGSGGGAYRGTNTGGAGNTPSVSPAQGSAGGNGTEPDGGAGGGGATAVGTNGAAPAAGPGGAGATSSINGTPTQRAGGGGGGADGPSSQTGGTGTGGGGTGGKRCGPGASAGTVNTGGGGGAGGAGGAAGTAGGSGVVIIRYRYQ